MKLNVLSDSDVAVLRQVIEREKRNPTNGRAFGEKLFNPEDDQNTPEVHIALLPTAGIPALTLAGDNPGENDEPGEAECVIYQLIDDGVATPQLKLMDTADKVVYNITQTDIEGTDGWVLIVKTKTGKWVAVVGGSSSSSASINMYNGIVRENKGCGYYEIELADWAGVTPADPYDTDGTGTGTGTTLECDPCDLFGVTGTSTSVDCGAEALLYEPTSQLVGLGTRVLAFDSESIYVPLKIPSDCLLIDIGDTNSVASVTGTGTTSETVYRVVRGLQEHTVQMKERWECCGGVDTLVGETPIIFAAKVCEERICSECTE